MWDGCVAELDPFGRRVDENPLAGLGSLSDGIEAQEPAQPVVSGRPSGGGEESRRDGSEATDERWGGAGDEPPPATPRQSPPPPMSASASAPPESPQAALRELIGAVESMQSPKGRGTMPALAIGSYIGRIIKIVVTLVVLFVLFSVGSTVFFAGKTIRDGISEFSPPNIERPSTDFGGGSPASRGGADPVGLGTGSLLQRRNLQRVLRRLRGSELGRLRTLRIAPERVDAQLLTKGGKLRSVQVRHDGKLQDFGANGGGFGSLPTVSFASVNSAAPSRLARSAAGRVKRPVSRVDYVVLLNSGGSSVWTVVMKGGGQFLSDARGRITRRIG